jgi:hypothetical protein
MLLAVAIFAMGTAFWSSQRPTAQPVETEKTDKSANQQKQQEGWLERAADPLVVITFLLVVVGAGQVGLFWRQLKVISVSLIDAKKAADAAKEAADAAKISADHVPRIERAYVFLNPVSGSEFKEFKLGRAGDLRTHSVVRFHFKNHGRTPARARLCPLASFATARLPVPERAAYRLQASGARAFWKGAGLKRA